MRQVLSISLPKKEITKIKSVAKKRGFLSFSAYIHSLIDADQNLISEAELLRIVKAADKEYAAGKSIRAKSMAELL